MAEESQSTAATEGGQQAPLGDDEARQAAEKASQAANKPKTRYMVLWSKVPEEEGREYRWVEIGWYEAHSTAAARKLAGSDPESGHQGRITDAAKQGPIALRAVAQSSWPEEPDISEVKITTELVIR